MTPKTFLPIFVCAASLMAAAPAALAQSNPYLKGPAPTLSSVQADGPFTVMTQTVRGSGFGGGTVYSPSSAGQYGLIAVCPGFSATQSSIAAMSRRLATHGFVVVAIDTITVLDLPGSRGNQLLAALRTTQSLTTGPVAGKIDAQRMAVAGWSMGGGGTLRAVETTPALKAGTPWAPWALSNELRNNRVPVAILGGSADNVASPDTFANVFYNAIPASSAKLVGIIRGAGHGFPTTASQPTGYTSVAWMKRFLDNDTRYGPFLTGDARFSSFQSTGPF
jgi:triacylglycerol lipase